MEMIVVTMDRIKITFMINSASVNAFKTFDTDESENICDTVAQRLRKSLQNVTSRMDGKNTKATAIMPTTPTLLRISEEYA